jgi:hypothetical protein
MFHGSRSRDGRVEGIMSCGLLQNTSSSYGAQNTAYLAQLHSQRGIASSRSCFQDR